MNNRTLDGTPSSSLVTATLVFGVISTAVHYTHNFIHAEHYPPVLFFPTPLAYRVGIVIFWPVLTLLGIWGAQQFAVGRQARAIAPLAVWSLLGFTSTGHFFGGVPDIPAYAMFTISTDFAAGAVMLVLMAQTRSALRRRSSATQERSAG